ncbi:MAG TPA: carbon-nitrogen family hydrolase [Proteobacteria bacterium]|nr:carbon-nitrogen family hydrolase [Pseudomonadota bacterium]
MPRHQLTLTLIQMNVTLGQPEKNLQRLQRLLQASNDKPDIVLLPELWSTGYDYQHLNTLAASTPALIANLAQLATARNFYIGGSLLEKDGDRLYNTFYLLAPTGHQVAAYRKIHLFSLMDEDLYINPGNQPCLIQVYDHPVGLLTCYDIRFPELSRALALAGAELLLVCAQWPKPRTAHWRTLLRARALENQLFVAGCNRIGQDRKLSFPGASAIYDPWGNCVLRPPRRQGAFTTTINLNKITTVRHNLDCFKDRRPEAYDLKPRVSR